ncbi:MAG: hypothetical protein QM791_09355 [Ferruginibacter sp.]
MQTTLGDFKLSATFFELLRSRCKIFSDHIYGSEGYWDKRLQLVFGNDINNEVRADAAEQIRACVLADTIFNRKSLQPSKDNFILLLDNVIKGEWRMLLHDSN